MKIVEILKNWANPGRAADQKAAEKEAQIRAKKQEEDMRKAAEEAERKRKAKEKND